MLRTWISLITAALTAAATAAADEPARRDGEGSNLFRLVKRFDFDERSLGNFETTPMRWERFVGPGFPAYALGRFDEQVGHDKPPSFRLGLRGGNVGYEYAHPDMLVLPNAEYVVVGYVRTEYMPEARAFVSACFADRDGRELPGSHRVSQLVGSTSGAAEWTRVEVTMPDDIAGAYSLRIQVWVLQSQIWHPREMQSPDPIVQQDIHGQAWFDDITVYHMPRARLRLSNAAGLVYPDQNESLLIDLGRTSSRALRAELRITREDGSIAHQTSVELADARPSDRADAPRLASDVPAVADRWRNSLQVPLPTLPPGLYTARLNVVIGSERLLDRARRFAVLPELPWSGTPTDALGLNLGEWRDGDVAGARELLETLYVGSAKVGIPLGSAQTPDERTTYLAQLNMLLRELTEARVEPVGVILPPRDGGGGTSNTIRSLLDASAQIRELFAPVLGQLGGILPLWQLGEAATELKGDETWDSAAIDRLAAYLTRFVTMPELVVPLNASSPVPIHGRRSSVRIPGDVPTRSLASNLDFLTKPTVRDIWLDLTPDPDERLSRQMRIADLARRVAIAYAVAPSRLYIPAPFESSLVAGSWAWEPDEEFIPLRTLLTVLSRSRPRGVVTHDVNTTAILFAADDTEFAVIWSRLDDAAASIDLYLGERTEAIDLWGRPVALQRDGARVHIPLGPTPIILYGIDSGLALTHASFQVTPTHIERGDADQRPAIFFRNEFDHVLSGAMSIRGPGAWRISPEFVEFDLGPGETLQRPVDIDLPARQIATDQRLSVELALDTERPTTLKYDVPLSVGLRDVAVDAVATWVGDALHVEQTLRNASDGRVSFSGFCDAPGRPRLETEFLNVAPGESLMRTYVIPRARELVGVSLHVGVDEIHGRRRLDQLVEVPR
ncbi:MAG: hypothetical protein U1D55_01300 [Phycisphaerae bacterium]